MVLLESDAASELVAAAIVATGSTADKLAGAEILHLLKIPISLLALFKTYPSGQGHYEHKNSGGLTRNRLSAKCQ